jgi:4-carboxymuconolactone decarboxylase
MTLPQGQNDIVGSLDAATVHLVRLAASITAGSEEAVRDAFARCAEVPVSDRWIEELVLQSYLFAGFPRALNAARVWRRGSAVSGSGGGAGGGATESSYADVFEWRSRGEETCATVYGANYDKLRTNIRTLHPALDEWMIVEGYGKVLSRPGLDLLRRELCIVAACAAAAQDRQLQSHLHGAMNAGATPGQLSATLRALEGTVRNADLERARFLWEKVRRSPR